MDVLALTFLNRTAQKVDAFAGMFINHGSPSMPSFPAYGAFVFSLLDNDGPPVLADFDSDGLVDFARCDADPFAPGYRVTWVRNAGWPEYFSLSNGTLVAADLGFHCLMDAAALRPSGEVDIVLSARNRGVLIYFNQGRGVFGSPVVVSEQPVDDLVLARANDDSAIDIVLQPSFRPGQVDVLLNSGSGQFRAVVTLAGSVPIQLTNVGTLFRDEFQSFIFPSREPPFPPFAFLRSNQTSPVFQQTTLGGIPYAAVVADVTLDGGLDLVVAGFNDLTWYEVNADRTGFLGTGLLIERGQHDDVVAADLFVPVGAHERARLPALS